MLGQVHDVNESVSELDTFLGDLQENATNLSFTGGRVAPSYEPFHDPSGFEGITKIAFSLQSSYGSAHSLVTVDLPGGVHSQVTKLELEQSLLDKEVNMILSTPYKTYGMIAEMNDYLDNIRDLTQTQ